jgi:F-type H+-transporting ATPase subunit b
MQIDWFTVVAQIVNFLILVWLLQHFLYRPIVRAMDRREQRIADRLNEARDREDEAEKARNRFEEERKELDSQREEILDNARQEADQVRQNLETDAREQAQAKQDEWLKQVEQRRQDFLSDLRQRAAEHFSALARRVLSDLADEQLEDRIATVFLRKIEEIDPDLRQQILKAARRDERKISVESAFELSSGRRAAITRTLREALGDEEIEVDYTPSEALTAGIRLKAGNVSAGWTLDSYLDDLEERLQEELQGMKRAEPDRRSAA